MKPVRMICVFAASIALSCVCVADSDTLTILHINDTHSSLAPHGPRGVNLRGSIGGIARAATLVGMTRASQPNVLFLHAGDLFIGDPMFNAYFGVPEFRILQQLGLDAMAVGNHEFDLTPVALQTSLDTSFVNGITYPLLSANTCLDSAGVTGLKTYIKPHLIKSVGNITVGVFGLTTPETNILSLPQPAVIDTALPTILEEEITALTTGGCDVVILLSHLGAALDQEIAASVPGIDVIVGGHDHYAFATPIGIRNPAGDTTRIVQAGAFYENIGQLRLTVDAGTVRFLDYALIPLDENVPEAETIIPIVDELQAGVDQIFGPYFGSFYSEVVHVFGTQQDELALDLTARREATTPVGLLVTSAFQSLTGTDIGLTVGGATAQPLPAGPVVGADVFCMLGYGYNLDNGLGYRMATFAISGLDLLKGLEWGLSSIELNDEYFPIGFPLRFTYDASRPPFGRLDSVWIGGALLDTGAVYSVTTNEFILAVMSGFVAPQLGMEILNPYVFSDTTEYAVVRNYLMTVGVYDGQANAVPSTLSLEQNYPNPFNPNTKIEYRLNESGNVKVSVFDLLGREVAVLINEEQPVGRYAVSWNAADMPSGMYICRLQSGNGSLVRRMLLLK